MACRGRSGVVFHILSPFRKRGERCRRGTAGAARSNFIHNAGFFKKVLKRARRLAMSAFV